MGLLGKLFRSIFGLSSRQPRNYSSNKLTSSDSNRIGTRSIAAGTLRGRCSVVDGDTIIIGKTSIRLAGIDAPELDHPYGNNAKWALINLCKGQVIVAVMDESSSYDRAVATCYLPDGRDISAEMVKMGMAVDWTKFSGGKYRQFELPDIRKKLWRCDARQKGRMPPTTSVSD